MSKVRVSTSVAYLLLVVICIFLAFDFDGAIDLLWTLVLITLTLPGSLISILFTWSLIHGAGLGFFAFIYLVSAIFNVIVVNWLSIKFARRKALKLTSQQGNSQVDS